MIHMHPDAWLLGQHDPVQERNLMHRVALREAKIATEYRKGLAETTRTVSPVRRLATAVTGTGSTTDLAACCA